MAYKGYFMGAKYYLLCPLCSYETEHISLTRTYRTLRLERKWMVCLECLQLQKQSNSKRLFLQTLKVLWLHVKYFLLKGRKHDSSLYLSKVLQKPYCIKCHGSQLLEWDGNCPRCGSAFLKKVV